jgi:ectoine hydroxylase-related dioxygenase (phytanoyl-CoA dioxygenase family)
VSEHFASDLDLLRLTADYERDGVVRVRRLFEADEIAELRRKIDQYSARIDTLPAGDYVLEADGKSVRNTWRMQQHDPFFAELGIQARFTRMIDPLVNGQAVLQGVETFCKPARVGSPVPYHQDNAYFCQTPPDMLTLWIAIDAATEDNGPVYYVRGSHRHGLRRHQPSGVSGNSMGVVDAPDVPLARQFCGTLQPGDALIHHCEAIHHSAANESDRARCGLLLVYRGAHTRTDPDLHRAYTAANA